MASIYPHITFDTLAFVKGLVDRGYDRQLAEALAEVQSEFFVQNLATKEAVDNTVGVATDRLERGMVEIETKLTQHITEVDVKLTQNIAAVEAKLTQHITEVEAKLTQHITEVDVKLTQNIADVRNELKQDIAAIGYAVKEVDNKIDREIARLENRLTKNIGRMFIAAVSVMAIVMPVIYIVLQKLLGIMP